MARVVQAPRSGLEPFPGSGRRSWHGASLLNAERTIRLVILIPSLELGGAERQAVDLAGELARRGNSVSLVTFYPGGPLAAQLVGGPVVLRCLGKRGRWDLGAVIRFRRLVHELRPQVVYTWLSQTNVWAIPVKLAGFPVRLVWSVRDAGFLTGRLGMAQRVLLRVESGLSGLADLVIANSEAGMQRAIARGFPRARIRVVSNGIEMARVSAPPGSRARLRDEWRLGDALVIGSVGRLDPIKDHATFLRAAALATARRTDLRFVIVGGGAEDYVAHLQGLARDLGIDGRVTWLGSRLDVPEILRAFDLFSLTSLAEGFPNALVEAMAAGLPCVATSVGDCARVLGSTGMVVPPGDPSMLCEAWLEMAACTPTERATQGLAARQRVAEHFTLASAAAGTEDLLRRLLSRRG